MLFTIHFVFIHTTVVLTVTAQKNLTPFGKATMSSSAYSTRPENAINPPISNDWSSTKCTHTDYNQNKAWWMFNISFGSAFITDITIYYRSGFASRMKGFKLYISNASTIPPSDSDLCYKDPDIGLPEIIQTISCYQLGQYVIYYDDVVLPSDSASIIGLCYVAINGCKKSYWGSNCTKSCTERCIDRHCYPGNGSCVLGCNTKHCLYDLCDKSSAVCTKGCRERRTGSYCNKYNIATDASVSQIQIGLKTTYLANDGDITSCFKSQGTDIRIQVDMNEIRVVKELHLTIKANITSKDRVHIIYASTSSVDPEKGTVLYRGESLPQHISTNAIFRYLTFVSDNKSASVELEICEIGIVGCPSKQYGPLCTSICPLNCRGPCDLEIGHCILGCSNGWIGVNCEIACTSGLYGNGCLLNCSMNCLTPPCDHTTGNCIGGCNSGWEGYNCTQVRSELQEELNSAAIGGSIGVVIAVILIIIAGCFIYKRKSKSTKNKYAEKSRSTQQTTFNKENKKEKTQSREQQHYEDVNMENVSTYQDLMTIRSTSNEYDQINTAYVNQ